MTAAPSPSFDDMVSVLSRAALYQGTDLGNESEAFDLLRRVFPHAAIDPVFDRVLERARGLAQQNAALHDAAGRTGGVVGFGLWALALLALVVLYNAPAHADEPATDAGSGFIVRAVPVVLGLVLVLWCLKHVALQGRPPSTAAESDADEVHRHNGEGR